MKRSPFTTFFSIGLLTGAAAFSLSAAEEKSHAHENAGSASALRYTLPLRGTIDSAEVAFKEFSEGADTVTAIPKSAIIREEGKTYVYAQPDEASEVFERWEVTLGYAQDSNYIEALTGVFPGDRVATSGFEKLTLRNDPLETDEEKNRVVIADGKGVVVRAPSRPDATPRPAPRAVDRTITPQRNSFGYQGGARDESVSEARFHSYPRYSNSRHGRLPAISSCDFQDRFECHNLPCESFDFVPSFAPSCEFPQQGYSYDVSPDYCPTDGYGYWSH